jgi:hypothetical protein
MGVHSGESLKQPTNNPHRFRLCQPFFFVENTLDIAPCRRGGGKGEEEKGRRR